MPSGTPPSRSAQTRRFDRPPSAAMSNAVKLFTIRLGDNQRRIVGGHGHPIGECDTVHHAPSPAVGREQGDRSRGKLAAGKSEALVVEVSVAATIHDYLVPGVSLSARPLRSAWVTRNASGSLRRSSPSRAETTSRRPSGSQSMLMGNAGKRTRTITSLLPQRSTAMISCAPSQRTTNGHRANAATRKTQGRSTVLHLRRCRLV